MTQTTPLSPATIVFCDVVGFSKYPSEKQQRVIISLNAEVTRELFPLLGTYGTKPQAVCLPTGDGLLIVIIENFETQVLLSLLMSLRQWTDTVTQREGLQRGCKLRTGVHVGRVSIIPDINRLPNVCGDDINMCRRIMDQARPNQVLFSEQAHETYVGHDEGGFSGYPFSGREPAEFRKPMTITVKHNDQLRVRVMTQTKSDGTATWNADAPLNPTRVVEGSDAVRERTEIITSQLKELLSRKNQEIDLYEHATFSSLSIDGAMEAEVGHDEATIRLLLRQQELFVSLLREKQTHMRIVLRRIPTDPAQHAHVVMRYRTLARWMDENLSGIHFACPQPKGSGVVSPVGTNSTVELREAPARESTPDSTLANWLVVRDAFRIDGYRLRNRWGHGLSLVYYDEDKINEAITALQGMFGDGRPGDESNRAIREKLRLFEAAPKKPKKPKRR